MSYLCPLHDKQIFFPVFPQWILERFKIYKFNDRCNLRTNLLFQTSADSQNCTSRVPLLFLALFLSSESRCGARNSTYRISNVIKLVWLRLPYWCDTTPTATVVVVLVVGEARELYRWPSWPRKKKHRGFIISMHVFFCFKGFSNFYRYGALLPGPSGRRSTVIKLDSSF